MQQQNLELENQEVESLKKRVYDLELRVAVHEKECEMRDKNTQEKISEMIEREEKIERKIDESTKEIKQDLRKKFLLIVYTALALTVSISGWSLTQLWNQSKHEHQSNYNVIHVDDIVYRI